MSMNVFIDYLKNKEGIESFLGVNKEDGTVLEETPNADALMEKMASFIGSTIEVISKDLNSGDMEYIYIVEPTRQVVVFPYKNSLFCMHINDTVNAHQLVNEILDDIKNDSIKPAEKEEEKKEEPVKEEKKEQKTEQLKEEKKVSKRSGSGALQKALLRAKIKQLQFLVEEFASDGDLSEWMDVLSQTMSDADPDEKVSKFIKIEGDKIALDSSIDIDIEKNEINTITKKFVDGLFKAAIAKYGASEAKKMVNNVIARLREKKG